MFSRALEIWVIGVVQVTENGTMRYIIRLFLLVSEHMWSSY